MSKFKLFTDSIDKLDPETETTDPELNSGLEKAESPVGNSAFEFGFLWPTEQKPFRERLLTFVETYYWENRKLPNKEAFEEKFNSNELPKDVEGWQQLLLSVQEALSNRGIPAFYEPKESLDAKFVLACNFIANHLDTRGIPAKLKEVGLTTKQFKGMLAQDKYLSYYKARVEEVFDEQAPIDAKLGLQKNMAAGDLASIKFYYELQNIYRPQTTANMAVAVMMRAIMEILTRHVQPNILTAIAAEIKENPQLALTTGDENAIVP